MKITRFIYNPEAATIGDPLDLISGLSGSVDHNSGRMTFSPDGRTIYMIIDSTGPMQAIKGGPIADQWNPQLADRVQVWGLQGSRKEHKSNYLVEDYTAACLFFCYHSVDLLTPSLFQQSVFLP
jgi:glucose/arabinose dehydrogenase